MNDKKLVKWLLLILLLPLGLAFFSEERFRYPCQDPANWDKDFCQRPLCDVTRTCPDHIFKGQRDPKLGSTNESNKTTTTSVSAVGTKGANCGK
jgi:hypothetical protein